jgi:hypothetical protein
VIGKPTGKAAQLAGDLGATPVFDGPIKADDAVLIDDVEAFGKNKTEISKAVRDGAIAVFLELPNGKFPIGGEKVAVDAPNQDIMIGASPGGLHFVSRDTGHPLVEGFLPNDFKFWYNAKEDRPTPLLDQSSFLAEGWEPILTSYNKMAAGWKSEGKGHWCICQIELAGRIAGNPVAAIFAQRLVAKAAAR